jgi:hypothetical protein
VTRDWVAWHAPYDDPASSLARRLAVVQDEVADWLAAHPGEVRAVSACAGEGRDLLPVVAALADPARVRARLVELDPANAAAARRAATGLDVEVVQGDAGVVDAYLGAVPADLVLMCGVFGNVPDEDVRTTVETLPQLCAPGATVIWTRHRKEPNLTPAIRRWLADAGFAEQAWHAPDDASYGVGIHRLTAPPREPEPGRRMFAFTVG